MATKQKPTSSTRSGAAKSKSAASARSRKAAGSSPAKRARTAAPRGKSAPPERRNHLAQLFAGHGSDIAAVFLMALGVISALGIFASAAGLVGRGLNTGFGAVVGLLRYAAPVAMFAGGVVLIRGSMSANEGSVSDPEASQRRARRVVGAVIVVAVVAGLAHLIVSPPSLHDGGLSAFAPAGGLLGGVSGGGLAGLAGVGGAAALLVMAGLLGVTLLIGRPIGELAQICGARVGPISRAMWASVSSLFRVGGNPADAECLDAGEPTVALYDFDADPANVAPAEVAARKSSRRRPAPAGEPASSPTITLPPVTVASSVEQLEIQLEPHSDSPWRLPPLSLLSRSKAQAPDTAAITERGRQLEAALAEHGVVTRLIGMVVGPTVTRYELELGVGVKVDNVLNRQRDIAYAMATPDVRITGVIPGRKAIGVEVPNEKRQIVAVGDILCSPEALKSKAPLSVAVGRDIEGHAVMVDIAKMPHILIAGQTGAGKSSCINSLMTSILMRATPDEVRLILVDPKRVELTQYNRVPHLLTQVVTNPKKAANALAWAVAEMERRYELLEEVGVRDIGGFNAAFDRGELTNRLGEEREFQRMPLILIVVDELADLMMVAARDVEESINRIAAKARAVGLHLVIATQRPSVNVITGVIKANIPARFAFSVASATDSKVIMNHGGAERLVGKGDLLFLDPAAPSAERIQGCWVEEKEVAAVVAMWRDQSPDVAYVEEVQGDANLAAVAMPSAGGSGGGANAGDDDDLLAQAMELVVRSQLGSTSMLQRKLKVGFARAGRLMDLLEERGVVGPSGGSKARDVLMTVEELNEMQGHP